MNNMKLRRGLPDPYKQSAA